MSRRTSEAQKGIRQAWKNEKQRVLEGKGTRDWTPEEQQSIIDIGIAKDENGDAYVGHHMKNAEKYPEYQGDPDNIQFLTKYEHLYGAHQGSWRNPSNGYYDPVTKEITDFGDGKYVPCKVIDLSNPTIKANDVKIADEPEHPVKDKKEVQSDSSPPKNQNNTTPKKTTNNGISKQSPHVSHASKVGDIKSFIGKAGKFLTNHAGDIAKIAIVAVPAVIKGIADMHSASKGSSRGGSIPQSNSAVKTDAVNDIAKAVSDAAGKVQRSSPKAHMVSGYDRVRYGKVEHIPSYPRGGKNKT